VLEPRILKLASFGLARKAFLCYSLKYQSSWSNSVGRMPASQADSAADSVQFCLPAYPRESKGVSFRRAAGRYRTRLHGNGSKTGNRRKIESISCRLQVRLGGSNPSLSAIQKAPPIGRPLVPRLRAPAHPGLFRSVIPAFLRIAMSTARTPAQCNLVLWLHCGARTPACRVGTHADARLPFCQCQKRKWHCPRSHPT